MKYDLEVHEVFWTVPFDILSLWLVFLVQFLKITLNILYRLLYLVVIIGSVTASLHWYWEKNHHYQSKQDHQDNFFKWKWDEGKSCWETDEDYYGNPYNFEKEISGCQVIFVNAAVIRVKYSVDFLHSVDELTISESLWVSLILISWSWLDKSLSIFIGLYDKSIILEFFINERIIVVSFYSIFSEK